MVCDFRFLLTGSPNNVRTGEEFVGTRKNIHEIVVGNQPTTMSTVDIRQAVALCSSDCQHTITLYHFFTPLLHQLSRHTHRGRYAEWKRINENEKIKECQQNKHSSAEYCLVSSGLANDWWPLLPVTRRAHAGVPSAGPRTRPRYSKIKRRKFFRKKSIGTNKELSPRIFIINPHTLLF